MMSDIEIAQNTEMKNINEIAMESGIDKKYLDQYGIKPRLIYLY